jgi:hypothetical protein
MVSKMEAPTEAEVREKLVSLIDGSGSRDKFEDWATGIVCMSEPPEMPQKVWEAVGSLALSAERDGGPDMPYIYGAADFENWLAELDAGS